MKKIILFIILSISFTFAQDYQVLLGIENLDEGAGTFDIRMINYESVGGFQVGFTGVTSVAASGGTAAAGGFFLSGGADLILGLSFTGATISAGNDILMNVTYEGASPALYFVEGGGTIISDAGGDGLLTEEYIAGPNGTWCAESDFDFCGNCYFESDHLLYDASYTYVEDSACTGCMESDAENYNPDATIACLDCCAVASDVLGCMDSAACNYNADATVDGNDPATTDIDESCWSANEGCNCNDAEGSTVDCAGTCNGSAEEDCAGTCNGDSVIDVCNICGGTGMDDCGECPGEDNLYGYTGAQTELGGENSTCTGCMDDTASNYNSTVGDPIQSSNECNDELCTYDCIGTLGGSNADCCYYAVDSSTITVTWDLTVVKDTTTTDDEGNSVPAVYMEIKDLTEDIEAVYRNWWFSTTESLYLTENMSEVNHFFTDVSYGDSTDVKLQIITNEGAIFEKSERVELKAPYLLSNNNSIPTKVWLSDNYPNPFNPVTSIEYSVEKAGHVNIAIYNVMGHKVYNLVSGYHSPGIHYSAVWNSNTQSNIPVSTGIYFYEMRSGDYIKRKKMVLVK